MTFAYPVMLDLGSRPCLVVGGGPVAERKVAGLLAAGDAAGSSLVVVAAGPDVAEAVSAECRQRGIWVNCADDPARCDFILPAVFRRGVLTVTVSTGGSSPLMASLLRDELDAFLPDEARAWLLERLGVSG